MPDIESSLIRVERWHVTVRRKDGELGWPDTLRLPGSPRRDMRPDLIIAVYDYDDGDEPIALRISGHRRAQHGRPGRDITNERYHLSVSPVSPPPWVALLMALTPPPPWHKRGDGQ